MRVDGKSEYNDFQKIKIEGREGEFIEKYDIISKYERRIGMAKLCVSQFGKMYLSAWKKNKSEENPDDEGFGS